MVRQPWVLFMGGGGESEGGINYIFYGWAEGEERGGEGEKYSGEGGGGSREEFQCNR